MSNYKLIFGISTARIRSEEIPYLVVDAIRSIERINILEAVATPIKQYSRPNRQMIVLKRFFSGADIMRPSRQCFPVFFITMILRYLITFY